jgi:hypothetical protein
MSKRVRVEVAVQPFRLGMSLAGYLMTFQTFKDCLAQRVVCKQWRLMVDGQPRRDAADRRVSRMIGQLRKTDIVSFLNDAMGKSKKDLAKRTETDLGKLVHQTLSTLGRQADFVRRHVRVLADREHERRERKVTAVINRREAQHKFDMRALRVYADLKIGTTIQVRLTWNGQQDHRRVEDKWKRPFQLTVTQVGSASRRFIRCSAPLDLERPLPKVLTLYQSDGGVRPYWSWWGFVEGAGAHATIEVSHRCIRAAIDSKAKGSSKGS